MHHARSDWEGNDGKPMTSAAITLERLRACIGREVVLAGERYRIVEVLNDTSPALVLCSESTAPTIQANQHGEATRRVPRTRTLPVFSADSGLPHPEFLKLNLAL
ncbi:MAG: hypothetical protein HZB57_02345 [Gammaproteobacteria bacterium]|nr:hypothetical protein [Gammaproteobacteria bacterium]